VFILRITTGLQAATEDTTRRITSCVRNVLPVSYFVHIRVMFNVTPLSLHITKHS